MHLQRIEVTKLFNTFDYRICLSTEEPITILIGPNGYGKTTILRMIEGLFNCKFSIFFKIPFQEFTLIFDNNLSIKVKKEESATKGKASLPLVNLIFSKDEKDERSVNLNRIYLSNRELYQKLSSLLEKHLHQASENREFNSNRVVFEEMDLMFPKLLETISEEREVLSFPPTLAEKLPNRGLNKNELDEIIRVTQLLKVIYIKTDRLLLTKTEEGKPHEINVPFVKIYSDNIRELIAQKLTESAEIARKLDSTFPLRIIERSINATEGENENIEKQLNMLREKRNHLKEVGIFNDVTEEINLPVLNGKEKHLIGSVLAEYVKDNEEKLAVFDELIRKIELFVKIINKQFFPGKQIEISKDRGFVIRTQDGTQLESEDLSSGEQHQLVLFYKLLFAVPAESLIMIDEPELSLHIAWQQEFLEDVINIARLSNIEVLVTTHSPSIVYSHWPLTIDLANMEN